MTLPRNLWPFGIIAAFVLFIAGTAALIVLASSQNEDLVSRDYYEEELRFQQQIDGSSRANELGRRASAVYEPANQRLTISLPSEQLEGTFAGRVQFYRPSAANLDREIKLAPDANGIQVISTAGFERGLWKVRVSWTVNGKDYFINQAVVVGESARAIPKS